MAETRDLRMHLRPMTFFPPYYVGREIDGLSEA